ncbi:RNA polymerase sigma factor [Adhaeribacter radiodurans]|uniref:Sigma-70 family RNA polymerase sigma factor n=1 Tax=Adhaeribacter radiodurans TaxID=2745197 RepID=A0A7L7L8I2_9BACT|nr:sigma-70 family RNA polymerase sigma factor [Adhaeribacter radiodurans]QMU29142.1 sigma-70 family RNA polymerase sigma factor [Adhaeribacter radiodurans]
MLDNTSRKEVERTLAISLQQGQPQVLALLYDNYAPVLLGLITRIIRNSQTAELVLQETFLAIWHKRTSYNTSQGGLLTWMIMVAKENALAALERATPNATFENGKFVSATDQAKTKDTFSANEMQPGKLFRTLTPNEKVALDLVYLKGCTCAEAAATLEISEEDLKIILQLAIKHLRANQT